METSPRELMGLKIITLFSCFDSMNVFLSHPNMKGWNTFGFASRRIEDIQWKNETKAHGRYCCPTYLWSAESDVTG